MRRAPGIRRPSLFDIDLSRRYHPQGGALFPNVNTTQYAQRMGTRYRRPLGVAFIGLGVCLLLIGGYLATTTGTWVTVGLFTIPATLAFLAGGAFIASARPSA
jgi:hypothetical protein